MRPPWFSGSCTYDQEVSVFQKRVVRIHLEAKLEAELCLPAASLASNFYDAVVRQAAAEATIEVCTS